MIGKKVVGICIVTLLITTVLPVIGTPSEPQIADTVVDQEQLGDTNAHHLGGGPWYKSAWQEFTPSMQKFEAVAVCIKLYTHAEPGFLIIRVTEGDSTGDLVYEWKTDLDHIQTSKYWYIPHVSGENPILEIGQKYTIELRIPILADLAWYYVDGNPYPGGISSIGECCDFAFKTFAIETHSRTINTPFLNWLQNHPNMFPILRLIFQRLGL